MKAVMNDIDLDGLGRLCKSEEEAGIRAAPPTPGMARIGARLFGSAYTMHRHDTYSIGVTLSGVQAFQYLGERRTSLPGKIIVLHPDELHDGGAGDDAALTYRMLYLEPAMLREALGDDAKPLPFLKEPVLEDQKLRNALMIALADLESGIDDLAMTQLLTEVADGLSRHSDMSQKTIGLININGAERARDLMDEDISTALASSELEIASGMDRFSLNRHFKALYGTSPHRYHLMRRLEKARQMINAGEPIADAAIATGFFDQSHLNRHFRKCFGMTPGRWRTLKSENLFSDTPSRGINPS